MQYGFGHALYHPSRVRLSNYTSPHSIFRVELTHHYSQATPYSHSHSVSPSAAQVPSVAFPQAPYSQLPSRLQLSSMRRFLRLRL